MGEGQGGQWSTLKANQQSAPVSPVAQHKGHHQDCVRAMDVYTQQIVPRSRRGVKSVLRHNVRDFPVAASPPAHASHLSPLVRDTTKSNVTHL